MKRYLGLFLRLIVSSFLIFYVIKTTPLDKIWGVMQALDWGWLVMGIPLLLILVGITAYRWQLLLKAQGIHLPLLTAMKWTYVGAFFNAVLPGLVGGDLVKAYYASKESTQRAAAATSVFVDRVVGLAALLLIGAGGAILTMSDGTTRQAGILAMVFLAGMIGFFILAFNSWILAFGQGMADRLAAWPWMSRATTIIEILKKVHESLYQYRSSPGILAVCILLSLVVHAMVVMLNIIIARSLGLSQVSWIQFALFVPVINALMVIPIHVGGLGFREAMYKHFLVAAGMQNEQAVAISLLVYFCQLTMNLVGGVVYLFARGKGAAGLHVNVSKEV